MENQLYAIIVTTIGSDNKGRILNRIFWKPIIWRKNLVYLVSHNSIRDVGEEQFVSVAPLWKRRDPRAAIARGLNSNGFWQKA